VRQLAAALFVPASLDVDDEDDDSDFVEDDDSDFLPSDFESDEDDESDFESDDDSDFEVELDDERLSVL